MTHPQCHGSSHVIPVPTGMMPSEAWAEIVMFGRLLEPDDNCKWAVMTCPGDDHCVCWSMERAA